MDADGGILPPPLVEAGGTATSTLRGEGLEEVGAKRVVATGVGPFGSG